MFAAVAFVVGGTISVPAQQQRSSQRQKAQKSQKSSSAVNDPFATDETDDPFASSDSAGTASSANDPFLSEGDDGNGGGASASKSSSSSSRTTEAILKSLEEWEAALDAIYKPDETEPEIPFRTDDVPDAVITAKRAAFKTRARTVSYFKKKAKPELIDEWFAEVMPTPTDPLALSINSERREKIAAKLKIYEGVDARDVYPHASAILFPGDVPASFRRVSKIFYPNPKIDGWQSTGVYAAPGERVKVSVSKTAVGVGVRMRIGSHTDNLLNSRQRYWRRFPKISREFGVGEQSFEIASPFGGLIYVYAPRDKVSKRTQFKISGVVEAPFYRLGETKKSDWEYLRYAPAPWAEFVGRNFIATVPAEAAAAVDDPEKVIRFWDNIVEMLDDFVAADNFERSASKDRIEPIRFVVDIEPGTIAGHSGDPIVGTYLWTRCVLDLDYIKKNGSWPLFLAIAKRMVSKKWVFESDVDAPAALLALYCMEKTTDRRAATFFDVPALQSACFDRLRRKELYEENKRAIRDEARRDELEKKAERKKILKDTTSGQGRRERKRQADEVDTQDDWADPGVPFQRLSAYLTVVDETGWEPLKKAFKIYTVRNRLPLANNDEKMRTFVMLWSQATKKNLSPFFEKFDFPRQNGATNYPTFTPKNFPPAEGLRPEKDATGFLGVTPFPTIAVFNETYRVKQLPEGFVDSETSMAKKATSPFGSVVTDDDDDDAGTPSDSGTGANVEDPFADDAPSSAGTPSVDDPFAEPSSAGTPSVDDPFAEPSDAGTPSVDDPFADDDSDGSDDSADDSGDDFSDVPGDDSSGDAHPENSVILD